MSDRERSYETLGVDDWVSSEFAGLGEAVLFQDMERRFRDWRSLSYRFTPQLAMGAISHLEAGNFVTPGDAPILSGLASSGIPAGSPQADWVYTAAHNAAVNEGRDWDRIEDPLERLYAIRDDMKAAADLAYERGERPYPGIASYADGQGPVLVGPEDRGFSIAGAFKGVSRWGMLLLDTIPEGLDAIQRAAFQIKEGRLSPGEAAMGMIGVDKDAAQLVGVPLFQYLADLNPLQEGGAKRLNMGTGFFAQGEIAPDIQAQMDAYDMETEGTWDQVTESWDPSAAMEKYNQERRRGKVYVLGPGGQDYEARSFEEWQFLRRNAGRAALLAQLQYNSPTQAALGQPHGTFNESVFDEGTVVRLDNPLTRGQDGYFVPSVGRTFAAGFTNPNSDVFDVVSAPFDFAKQLVDLNLLGVVGKGGLVAVNKAKKFIGLGGEAGDLITGSAIAKGVLNGADEVAAGRVLDDLGAQTLNREAAANALARHGDEPLQAARTFTASIRRHAGPVLETRRAALVDEMVKNGVDPITARNIAGKTMTEGQIDNLIRRASQGDQAAQSWVRSVMGEAKTKARPKDLAEQVARSVDNLAEVGGREGVDLVGGVYGQAQVADEIWEAATSDANKLADMLEGGRASFMVDRAKVVKDPDLGLILSYDADIGRAQNTLLSLFDEVTEAGRQKEMVRKLVEDNWMATRMAENILGGGDEAHGAVANLKRVLRRNEDATAVIDDIMAFQPRLGEGQLRKLLTGSGAVADMVETLRSAKTMREVDHILGATKEYAGRTINPALKRLFVEADTTEEILQAMIQAGQASLMLPQKIGLLGRYARAGSILTGGGAIAGGTVGVLEQPEDASLLDNIGGAISGAILGGLAGSALSGVAGALGGGLTRNIEHVADSMDLMLAGTRSMTSDILRMRGVDVGRAQAGLSAPQLMAYGFGHTGLGRSIARSYRQRVNVNDPYDLYYTMVDFARGAGVVTDDVVTVFQRGTGEGREIARVVRSDFKDLDDYAQAMDDLLNDGYQVSREINLDDAMRHLASVQPYNPADAFVALEELGRGIDNILVSRGMDEQLADVLTSFFKEGQDAFMGNVTEVGRGANFAQGVVLNGNPYSLKNAPLLESEMWTGQLHLPQPEKLHRAVAQLDKVGHFTQIFTGQGVASSVANKLRGLTPDVDWHQVLTPELERNVAMRVARKVTATAWAPMVLLTRPISFMARVLGEDQARMTAAGMDSMFTHPWNYMTAVLSDTRLARAQPRGIFARSVIPDEIFDDAGNLLPDALDDLSELQVSERVKHGLGILDPTAKDADRIFGQTYWTMIEEGTPSYKKSVSGEFRQLVANPMNRRLAASTADDPIEDTLQWLTTTKEGRRVWANWAKQFKSADQARWFGATADVESLRAFLWDQYARMHRKTGGDWIFVYDPGTGHKIALNSAGEVLPNYSTTGLDAGYHIIRKGHDDMIEAIKTGHIKVKIKDKKTGAARVVDRNIAGPLTDHKWGEIHNYVSRRIDETNNFKATKEAAEMRVQGLENQIHSFPRAVKGSRVEQSMLRDSVYNRSVQESWDRALDWLYNKFLGEPTNVLSRRPVLGQYYWERMGLLYHSMDEVTQNKVMALATREGADSNLRRIIDELEDAGQARGIIDDFDLVDLNAKAYAVERTKDILFDLTRQRNFIDAMRIAVPFAGPMVEALEAWGRVVRQNPVYVWRRGTQLVSSLWDGDPLSLQKETVGGMFWTDEDGTEMVTYPWSGPIMDWMHSNVSDRIPAGKFSARARGFNIVFGPDDLAAEDQPDLAGVPLAAFNVGIGPSITLPFSALKAAGLVGEESRGPLMDLIFPYGLPNNAWENFMPYHLRKELEGSMGAESQAAKLESMADQLGIMVAAGLVGEGPDYEYDISKPGEYERAVKEAHTQATAANWVRGAARGTFPTLITPELYDRIEVMDENGVNTDMLMNITALQRLARQLYSEEGAEVVDIGGQLMSTEGDWEVITLHLNQQYGTKMYSASLLNTSPSVTVFPRLFTESAYNHAVERAHLYTKEADIRNTAHLLMPNYAEVERTEEFSFKARELAEQRQEVKFHDLNEFEIEIQSRLLTHRFAQIEREATTIFGPDDLLDSTERSAKTVWENDQKADARGVYERAVTREAVDARVVNELLAWNQRDWDSLELDPAEEATVRAVLWYLEAEATAESFTSSAGLTKLTNKGSNDYQREMGVKARGSLVELVSSQIQYARESGLDLGNFPYLWARYLRPRLEVEDEPDPLADLAEQMSPYGPFLGVLREDG